MLSAKVLSVTTSVAVALVQPALALGPGPNGLALTPPMGWMSWERFRCNIDCANDPENCISESLYKTMADHIAADGYLEAGYNQVSIDDCWENVNPRRDPTTKELSPDPKRFPSGLKALGDYLHSKGVRFGIYSDEGTSTCGGYPGSEGYEDVDAKTFASWGVDYLKLGLLLLVYFVIDWFQPSVLPVVDHVEDYFWILTRSFVQYGWILSLFLW